MCVAWAEAGSSAVCFVVVVVIMLSLFSCKSSSSPIHSVQGGLPEREGFVEECEGELECDVCIMRIHSYKSRSEITREYHLSSPLLRTMTSLGTFLGR